MKPYLAEDATVAPASLQQEGVWFHALNTTDYYWNFIQKRCYRGNLDRQVLYSALDAVLQRHASLRTNFRMREDGLRQVVRRELRAEEVLKFEMPDANDEEARDRAMRHALTAAEKEGFDLEEDALIRLKVLQFGAMHFFILTVSHIVIDAFSMGIFWSDLSRWYNLILSGGQAPSAPQQQYIHYCATQHAFLQTEAYQRQKAYWLSMLSGEWPEPAFPLHRGMDAGIHHYEMALSPQLAEDIRNVALRRKVLYSSLFQAAYFIFLHKYWQQDRIAVGNVVDGRGFGRKEYKGVIGLFARRLVNVQRVEESEGLGVFLEKVNKGLLEGFVNGEVVYEPLVREINQLKKRGLHPLFRAVFNLIKGSGVALFEGLEEVRVIEHENTLVGDTQYDIGLSIFDDVSRIVLRLDVKCTEEWKPCVEWFLRDYIRVLEQCVYQPDLMVKDAGGPGQEMLQLLEAFNPTAVDHPGHETLTGLLSEQAMRSGTAPAVVFGPRTLSYQELDEAANQLGHYLRGLGVDREVLTAICMERSPEMLLGMLGILKAGGAFVPVDPAYPPERIAYILSDIDAKVVVCSRRGRSALPAGLGVEVVLLDEEGERRWNDRPRTCPSVDLRAENLAYVIYTSGSTGRPKGVMVEHRSVVNYLRNALSYLGTETSLAGCFAYLPFTFDAAITGIFVPLIAGRTVVLSVGEGTEVFEDAAFDTKGPYDHIKLTPAHLYLLERAMKKMGEGAAPARRLVLGGEALQAGALQFLTGCKSEVEIINEYGPTEATVGCCTYTFPVQRLGDRIPIGRPMNNVRMYILDKHGKIVGPGVAGEIYIGGVQVARGYLGQPELTETRFITGLSAGGERDRWYRTGDAGRWMADGNIEYLGRLDEQLKIRGYRIEPGEIEAAVLGSGLIQQVAVTARDDGSGNFILVGYVVGDGVFDPQQLMEYLRGYLPHYMIPAVWVNLSSLPLSATGKVDRHALKGLLPAVPGENGCMAPRSELEKALADIWQEVLGVEQVGIRDNFFSLGGHSISVMKMLSLLRQRLDREAAVRDLFTLATVEELAAHLEKNRAGAGPLSIKGVSRPGKIPLSFSQERLWFIHRLEGSVHYHIPWALRLQGRFSTAAFEAACRAVVDRHEVLRTVVEEEDGKGYQRVMEEGRWRMELSNGARYREDPEGLMELMIQLMDEPFDLSRDHMLRVHIIVLSETEHVMVMTLHHMAADGWSWSILMRELTAAYAAYDTGSSLSLPLLPVQYVEYTLWQRSLLEGKALEGQLDYWRRRLAGVSPLEMPVDHPRPAVQSTRGDSWSFAVDDRLTGALRSLSRLEEVTLFMTLMAAFKVLLSRYSGQKDICVGTPVAGRKPQETEGMIGSFINTLAIRSDLSGDLTFRQLLQQVKGTMLDAFDHQDLPFEKVVEAIVPERDLSRSPIFQVILSMNSHEMPEMVLAGVEQSEIQFRGGRVKFDLTMNVVEVAGSLTCHVQYCKDLFEEATIHRMVTHYRRLLESIAVDAGRRVGELPMLTEEEELALEEGLHARTSAYPRHQTLADLFSEQAARTPGRAAVRFGGQMIDYRELEERSNRLGHYLRELGVCEEKLTGICVSRGIEMVIGILGVLKAGGAYVPIDPGYPAERIAYMMSDAGVEIVLSTRRVWSLLHGCFESQVVLLDGEGGDWEMISRCPASCPETGLKPEHLAYVLYTSGSTGRPKGVMVEHRNVMALVHGFQEIAPPEGETGGLSLCPYVFDVSVWELFINLCFGNTLHILDEEAGFDPGFLAEYICRHAITTAYIPPTILPDVVEHLEVMEGALALRRLLVGVLPIRQAVLQRWADRLSGCRIINGYGPTEATVCASFFHFRSAVLPDQPTPIGRPVCNYRVYLLDEDRRLIPPGIRGEIYIAGDGVGRGYLNNPALTEERFIEDPFSKGRGGRMYRTGDLAKWLPTGDLLYIGRQDDQVKIRGYRIEPGEIEGFVQQSGMVRQNVVVAREGGNGRLRLVGYVTAEEGFDPVALRSWLLRRLPEYMVPGLWVCMPALPVTPSGKVDKQRLPDPVEMDAGKRAYEAPRNQLESIMVEVWQSLLGVQHIGIHDNFFLVGGDSIITIQICSRVRRDGYILRPRDIFLHQTIAQLSAMLTVRGEAPPFRAEQGMLEGFSGLLPIQQWWLGMDPAPSVISHFNQSVLCCIDKSIGPDELSRAMALLVARHDALRNVYTCTSSGWLQHYGSKPTDISVFDLSDQGAEQLPAAITARASMCQAALDIGKGILVKAALMKTPLFERDNRWLLVIHHLAVDGVSWRILMEDLEMMLRAIRDGSRLEDGSKTSSCRDWRRVLEEYGNSRRLLSQCDYWQSVVCGGKVLRTDMEYSGECRVKDMDMVTVLLPEDRTSLLLKEAQFAYHTEMNDLLLAALARTLSEWSGESDVLVGLEGHGREEEMGEGVNLTRTVGWLTSLYPVLLETAEGLSFESLIKRTKEGLRSVPDKGLGYGVLKYIVQHEALAGKEPWEILFNYLGQLDKGEKGDDLFSRCPESPGCEVDGGHMALWKLSVNCWILGGELRMQWAYSGKHFHHVTVQGLADAYICHLDELIAHCTEPDRKKVFTPADFGLGADISYQELDSFFEEEAGEKDILEL
ncbi:MAG: amino acid adenylation domain-containing protein [Chitinophagaceae bacterium]|nr:amino acid adenylation domain-containing protein [Chitinophagaceae bacterium]